MTKAGRTLNIEMYSELSCESDYCAQPILIDPEKLWGIKSRPIIYFEFSSLKGIICLSLGADKTDLFLEIDEFNLITLLNSNQNNLNFGANQIVDLLRDKRLEESNSPIELIKERITGSIVRYVFQNKEFELKLSKSWDGRFIYFKVKFVNCDSEKNNLTGNLFFNKWEEEIVGANDALKL